MPEAVHESVVVHRSGDALDSARLGLRAWGSVIARAAFDLGVGPLIVVAAIEPFVVWPLVFGIVATAALVLALLLAWARVRFGERLASFWLVAAAITLACLLAAQPWWLPTGWPIMLGCAALFITGPLWIRAVRSSRGAAIASWVLAASMAWFSARVYVGLYASLHLAAVVLALSVAAVAASRALPLPSERVAAFTGLGMAACVALSLTPWGARMEVRSAVARQPSITPDLLGLGWSMLDMDGDGAASVWGGSDCAPLDPRRGPTVWDVPGDGIDQDCTGHDRALPGPAAVSTAPARALVKSILIVTGDALRPSALGAYGKQKLPVSVNIDAWARGAVRFQRVYAAAPATRDSLPALMFGSPRSTTRAPSLALRVGAQGMEARAVLSSFSGFAEQVRSAGFAVSPLLEADSLRMNAKVLDELAEVAPKGGVLWVHYHDPHGPYQRVPGIDWGAGSYQRYLALVTRLDRAFGELLAHVPADMAVIFASDHGEAFGEHGTYYHSSTLYDEQLRVPLFIAVPGIEPRVVEQTVGLLDVYATALELLGLAPTPNVYSRSLVPALHGAVLPDVPYRASAIAFGDTIGLARSWVGVIYGDFKLVRRADWSLEEVYDIARDPEELRPNTGRAAEMRDRLRELL